ncbi:MAG: PDDEXK nuclease domain-containing protein [Nostoc sp. DedQUE09]|nr:PDDEXK nuclease domain-containing protein [Nostoc sp. DedQUE09]MDZ7949553.1 PDDEXK nuclease domain-containing protein [Nostoc sp. DedQUE09]
MPRDKKSKALERGVSDVVGYEIFLTELKTRISSAQLRAAIAVNKELVLPYTFDFLNLGEDFLEPNFEPALINHIRDFLIELGVGFGYLGSQYHLEVGGEDFYIDLLFYHARLHCL